MTDTTQDTMLRGHRALWHIEPPLPDTVRQELQGESVMLSHLLYCRGLTSAGAIRDFFAEAPVSHDPFLLPDMEPAVARIGRAWRDRESVAVYGDFDCDGITSAAVLMATLQGLGMAPEAHIPEREHGHGLHPEALAELADRGVTLIITADCGITAIEEVQVARGLGIDVIVTDHHEPRPDGSLPACLVIAPTRLHADYPFRALCGAGVAFKLAQAVALRIPGAPDPDELLDLVALGTVADVVPLRDENRSLVIRGLSRLRCTQRPGLLALFRVAGIEQSRIDPTSLGFYLAPRINAANRMASPRLAYELLTATDEDVATELAALLTEFNTQRQALVARHLEELLAGLDEPAALTAEVEAGRAAPLLLIEGSWPAGISGLLASKLVDEFGLPAFVGVADGSGRVSVSARGIPGVRIDELLELCEAAVPGGLFEGYGGHSRAGGFRLRVERWEQARRLLEEQARRKIALDGLGAVLTVDAEVRLGQLSLQAAQLVKSLAPFGMDFPEPLFLTRNVRLRRVSPMNGKPHVRFRVYGQDAGMNGVFFNAPPQFADLPVDTPLDVVYHLQIDEYGGFLKPELRLRDWRTAG